VIDGAQDIKVDFNDGRTFDAKLIEVIRRAIWLCSSKCKWFDVYDPGDSDKVRSAMSPWQSATRWALAKR
jgi:hypothetical protein